MDISAQLVSMLGMVRILPRRLLLETTGVAATVPMLRGVWGAALHELDGDAYRTVFAPQTEGSGEAASLYVLRPAPPDPDFAPAIEWISIGAALTFDRVLERAWDIASGMGLGPERRRFHVRRVHCLGPDGKPRATLECGGLPPLSPADRGVPLAACPLAASPHGQHAARGTLAEPDEFENAWPLSAAAWPLDDPAETHCRLVFPAPLRLRRHGKLIDEPTLPDLIAAATRRIAAYLPADCRAAWKELSRDALELARSRIVGPWRGQRLDLHRYSARQESELDLHGVTGSLDLPNGPGEIWPLLAAAQWLHLGKSTVMGLGQLIVEHGGTW
ncbi:MAG: CRISPR system precrRNA processing endoribonuclease RAMP protein Cas6 [Thermoguttaceae bacterium]